MKKGRTGLRYVIGLVVIGLLGSFSIISAQLRKQDTLRALEQHDKAVYVLQENITNPFIDIGPDGYYYLTGTVPRDSSSTNELGVTLWRSKDLAEWEAVDEVKHPGKSAFVNELRDFAGERNKVPEVWSPKAHYVNGHWVIVHTSNVHVANLMLSSGHDIAGPYTEPLRLDIGFHVDPTIFVDDDGTPWLVSNCTQIKRLKKDFSGFNGNHRLIGPKNRQLGFGGSSMVKIGDKYVLFGSSWSTDIKGKGTYNLYYTTADHILGPYSPRKFVGRFIGNGSPFKDKKGRWWALAFYNADSPLLTPNEAMAMDLSDSSYTINHKGVTLVPLRIVEDGGEIEISAKDPAYRLPGKEEEQRFGLK